jgi:glycosyltransferase involved in cell wall biosynthesis
VLGGLDHGGTERLCLDVVRHAPEGTHSTVLVLDETCRAMEGEFRKVPSLELVWVGRNSLSRFGLFRYLWEFFGRMASDGVIVYSIGVPQVITGLAGRLRGVTVYASAGNPPPEKGQRDRWKWIVIVALSRVAGTPIQACSHMVEVSLRSLGIGLPRGSGTISNGSDIAGISATAEAERWCAPKKRGTLVVGMVARLDTIKDQATLLRAFARVCRTIEPAVELWLVGDGESREYLKNLAKELSVASRTRFLGARDDVPKLLGQMDVYAFSTTREEGLGIALVEAMAAGLPVVASDVPACREVLDGGRAGALVPAGDPDAMAAALDALLVCEAERRRWGALAQARARHVYDIACCAERWYQLLSAGAPRAGASCAS